MRDKIKAAAKKQFQDQEELLEKQGKLKGNSFDVEFVYGNRHELVPNPQKVGKNK